MYESYLMKNNIYKTISKCQTKFMSRLQGRFLDCHNECGYSHCAVLKLLFLGGIVNEVFREPQKAVICHIPHPTFKNALENSGLLNI